MRPHFHMISRPESRIVRHGLVKAKTRSLDLDRFCNPDVIDAASEPLPFGMSRAATGFLERRECRRFGFSRAAAAGHEALRWLVRSRIEGAADNRKVGVVSSSDPFSKLSNVILPCSIFRPGGDEMRDVHIKESSVDLKAGRERDTVMGAIVEARRLDNRVTREQPFGL